MTDTLPLSRLLPLLAVLVACTGGGETTDPPAECLELTGPIEVSGTIDSDTEWRCTNVPYRATADVLVGGGATLTIGPSVTVEFLSQGTLLVGADAAGGGLIADGTDGAIRFTSAEAIPSPGDWEGILIDGNTLVADLHNVTIEYAGDFTPDGSAGGNGALVVVGEVDLTGSTITDSAGWGVDFLATGRAGAFGDNTFADNADESIRVFAPNLASLASANTFSAGDRIRVDAGTVDSSGTWAAMGAPYLVVDDILVEDPSMPMLTIDPGVELQFETQATLIIGSGAAGGLTAVGTPTEPIVFTSAQAVPESADWEGVVVDGNVTTATLRNATFSYGGDFSPDASAGGTAVLRAIEAEMTVEDCTFSSNDVAVRFDGTARATSFSGNTFEDNGNPLSAPANAIGSLSGPNAFDAGDRIEVRGDTVSESAAWLDIGAPYHLVDDVLVEGSADPVLTLGAGVEVQHGNQVALLVGVNDDGGLIADGTKGRITLTSDQPVPEAGDWEAVVFDGNTLAGTVLRSVDLSYCGDFTPDPSTGVRGCVGVIDSSPTIADCTLDASSSNGIDLVGSASPTMTGNTFTNIDGSDVD